MALNRNNHSYLYNENYILEFLQGGGVKFWSFWSGVLRGKN